MEYLIDIETTITAEIYRSMVYFQTYFSKSTALLFNLFAGVVAVINVAAKWMGIYDPGHFLYYGSLLFLALAIVTPVVLELQIRSFIKSDRVLLGHPHRLQVGEAGVSSTAGEARAEYKWEQLFSARENKQFFLFYVNSRQAMVLPKAEISAEQAAALRALCTEKLGKKFYLHCK